MEKKPEFPREGRLFIVLQHISEEGKYLSMGDPRRQAEAVGSALAGLWHVITGKYPYQEKRKLLVVEAGSGQGRLHPYLSNYLNAKVVGIERHSGAAEEGRRLGRSIILGDYTEKEPWEKLKKSFGNPDLAFMVYTSLQGDPTKDDPRELMKKALIALLGNTKAVLFEAPFPTAGLEALINNEKTGEIDHGEGIEEKYWMTIIPHEDGFGWWVFEQTLHDEKGNIIARQRSAIPIPLSKNAFHELLSEVGEELDRKVKIIDIRDRDSHKPAGKEYAHWYLLTTEEVKHPYKDARVLERHLSKE